MIRSEGNHENTGSKIPIRVKTLQPPIPLSCTPRRFLKYPVGSRIPIRIDENKQLKNSINTEWSNKECLSKCGKRNQTIFSKLEEKLDSKSKKTAPTSCTQKRNVCGKEVPKNIVNVKVKESNIASKFASTTPMETDFVSTSIKNDDEFGKEASEAMMISDSTESLEIFKSINITINDTRNYLEETYYNPRTNLIQTVETEFITDTENSCASLHHADSNNSEASALNTAQDNDNPAIRIPNPQSNSAIDSLEIVECEIGNENEVSMYCEYEAQLLLEERKQRRQLNLQHQKDFVNSLQKIIRIFGILLPILILSIFI